MKKILSILFALISVAGFGQDTLKVNYGTAFGTGWDNVADVNTYDLDPYIVIFTGDLNTTGNSGVVNGVFPDNVCKSYLYSNPNDGANLITKVVVPESGDYAVNLYCSRAYASERYSNIYINDSLYYDKLDVGDNDSILTYNVYVSDTLKIETIEDNAVYYTYMNALLVYPAADGEVSHCDTVTIEISADIVNATIQNNTGAVDITVTGGTTPYNYSWSNEATTEDLTDLMVGEYTVTVTDDSSCFKSESFTIAGFSKSPTFSSNFEDQNIEDEISSGGTFETGTSGGYQIIANPSPDAYNTSDYVLKVFTEPGTGGRAEYSTGRFETNEKKYIYTWKRFYPVDMWTDIDRWTALQNQWKSWPCQPGDYGISDTTICGTGGGIFNDMTLQPDGVNAYRARAEPNCNSDYTYAQEGIWHEYTLEIYWTTTFDGYYKFWRNDTLYGQSVNIRTLFTEFIEGTCDLYWTTGLYTGWGKTGGETNDSLISYLDDVAIYDIDSGFIISDVCPECEVAPVISADSNVYKINIDYHQASASGYNNFIKNWGGDTSDIDIVNTFGQNNGIDVYLWSTNSSSNSSLDDVCFPDNVINTYLYWQDEEVHQIYLKDLEPNNTYTFKVLGAGGYNSSAGTQIWTTEENRDTVFSYGNTCNIAKLTNLVSDEHGDLTINVTSIGETAYLNAIELVEYTNTDIEETETEQVQGGLNTVYDDVFWNNRDAGIASYNCPEAGDANYTNIYYIDPSQGTNGSGTEVSPYNDFPATLSANSCYLVKRGTSSSIETGIQSANYVIVGAYGTGDRPNFYSAALYGGHVVVRDVHLTSGVGFGQWPYNDVEGNWIYNCEMRQMGVFTSETKIIGNIVHGAPTDAIWISGAEYGNYCRNIEIAWNHVYDVNMNWFEGATQSDAPGDAIQAQISGLAWIHHNLIDRSSTGNKFNIILGEPAVANADTCIIEYNVMYSPIKTSEGGAFLYLKDATPKQIIRNNIFVDMEGDGLTGIFSQRYDMEVYGNLMVGIQTDIVPKASKFYNNTLYDLDYVSYNISDYKANNIVNPATPSDYFVSYANGNYTPVAGGSAIDAGTWETWMDPNFNTDIYGTTIPHGSTIDLGFAQYSNSVVSFCDTTDLQITSISSTSDTIPYNTGTATVTASGGFGSLSYLWSNTQTTSAITGLENGRYYVTVTDDSLCSASSSVAVALVDTNSYLSSTDTLRYYTFTGNAIDQSGNQNGTVSGASLTTDISGTASSAYFFDNTDYIDIGDIGIDKTDSMTFSAFIKTSGTNEMSIVSSIAPNSAYVGIQFSVGSNGRIGFIISGSGASWPNDVLIVYGDTVNNNEWHHVVATYNGTLDQSGVKIYVDSVQCETDYTYNSLIQSGTAITGNNYAIGARLGGTNNTYFAGVIDEVQVYQSVLSSDQLFGEAATPEPNPEPTPSAGEFGTIQGFRIGNMYILWE